jgi:hypothetical protein
LRAARGGKRGPLLTLLEEALGGRVVLEDSGRFYLDTPHGKMEAPLVAEGLRKLGMIDYLLVNGTLMQGGFLQWDEPEANLNPKLARLASQLVFGVSALGVQIWLATHDYSLASELSLAADRKGSEKSAFFSLTRDEKARRVNVERGAAFTDLQYNAILGELHDRELSEAAREGRS